MSETLFALTNDDAGAANPELFEELLDFLDEQSVRATFFVTPYQAGRRIDAKPEWMVLLERAFDAGHELQLHAFDHSSTFEFGVPPAFMLDIIPDAKARWETEPEEVQKAHSLELMSDRIARGKAIFQQAFGYEPRGFRGPCLSMCANTYQALADHGFVWSSNRVVNPMGWRYINKDYDAGEPWQADVPPHPYVYTSGIIEIPMLSEYTWYLTPDVEERHFDLIKNDYDRVREVGGAFLTLSHYYAMTGEWATGLEVYRRLFEHARDLGDVRFVTVSEMVDAYPVE